jgi:hypothetical protein
LVIFATPTNACLMVVNWMSSPTQAIVTPTLIPSESLFHIQVTTGELWIRVPTFLNILTNFNVRKGQVVSINWWAFQLILNLLHQQWSKTEKFNRTRRIDKNMQKSIINFFQTE